MSQSTGGSGAHECLSNGLLPFISFSLLPSSSSSRERDGFWFLFYVLGFIGHRALLSWMEGYLLCRLSSQFGTWYVTRKRSGKPSLKIMHALCSRQSLSDSHGPMYYSQPGSSVHTILQTRILSSHFLLEDLPNPRTEPASPCLLNCRQIFHRWTTRKVSLLCNALLHYVPVFHVRSFLSIILFFFSWFFTINSLPHQADGCSNQLSK